MKAGKNISGTFQKIHALLHPTSIAIVGASSKKGKIGNIIFEGLLRSGVRLYPVNPKETEVCGYKAYANIHDIPDRIDVVLITIGAKGTVQVVKECTQKNNVENIIIISSGFGEVGTKGKQLEEQLKNLVEDYGIRILGPNSLGVFVPENNLDTIFVEHGDKALAGGGGVAFITQSGSVGVESLGLASNIGFGMRAFVGLGNKIDFNELDFLQYFGQDDKTECLALYVENIEHGREFLKEAQKISRQKPVIVLKAGRTAAGASAVSSHTGKLAGSDKVVSGAFRQFGIQRAYDDEEICDAAKVLSHLPAARGSKVAVITPAGGFGVMCTDYIDSTDQRAQLQMAKLSESSMSKIKENALEFASWHNPIDLTAGVTNEMYTNTLEALIEDEGVDIIICIVFLAPPAISDSLIDEIAEQARTSHKPVLVFTEYGPFTEGELKTFYKKDVIGFPSLVRTVRAARFLVERGEILMNFGGEL